MTSSGRTEWMFRRTAGEVAANYVRNLIVDQKLAPGERIHQDEIATELGMSRIPVREAMIVLENEGWVTIEMHRGAFVSSHEASSVADHYELYGLILGFAAKLAIRRRLSNLASELNSIRIEFDSVSDVEEKSHRAILFNRMIVDSSDSTRLRTILRSMRGVPLGDFYELVPNVVGVQSEEMEKIVSAVATSDPPAAAAAYRRLMSHAGAEVLAVLRERRIIEEGPP